MGVGGVDEGGWGGGGRRCRLELIDRSRRLSATARRIALSMPELSRHITSLKTSLTATTPPPLPSHSPPLPHRPRDTADSKL